MSTPELLLLLKILPEVKRNPPAWMTSEERATLERLVGELLAA
jgi:hypothetical protein